MKLTVRDELTELACGVGGELTRKNAATTVVAIIAIIMKMATSLAIAAYFPITTRRNSSANIKLAKPLPLRNVFTSASFKSLICEKS